MPKVEQYGGPKVSRQLTRAPRLGDAPAGAFGGNALASGFGDVAGGIERLGKGIAIERDRADVATAQEAFNKFEKDSNKMFFDPDSGYFNTQGRDAYEGGSTAAEQLEKLRTQYESQFKSEGARQYFKEAADRVVRRGQADIQKHAASGLKAWETAGIQARADNSVENAHLYWADPTELGVQREVGRQAIIDANKSKGLDDADVINEDLQSFDSNFYSAAVKGAAAQDAAAGRKVLEEHRDKIEGPDATELENYIKRQEEIQKTKNDAAAALRISQSITSRFTNRSDGLKYIDDLPVDSELKSDITRETAFRYDQVRKAREEEQGVIFDNFSKAVLAGDATPEPIVTGKHRCT